MRAFGKAWRFVNAEVRWAEVVSASVAAPDCEFGRGLREAADFDRHRTLTNIEADTFAKAVAIHLAGVGGRLQRFPVLDDVDPSGHRQRDLVDAGATRLGCSASVAIVNGQPSESSY